jgi:radical SAM superfamily enzyme YgiQ (UPF0313 family)
MATEINIKLIALEKGITCIGLRRISSLVKSKYPNTTTYVYDLAALSAKSFLKSWILSRPPKKIETSINEKLVEELAKSDILGLSCVSLDADQAKQLINLVKEKNPKTLVVWGGVHATLYPEDAINYADIVCIGEGEKSIMALLNKIEQKDDFSTLKGLWVRQNGKVSKNEFMPLMSGDELGQMPFQDYGFDIKYVTHNSMEFMTRSVYVSILGSTYNTMWVMGCPYHCSYCANDKFLANNMEYGKLRHASAEFIIEELIEVKKRHNYINYVILMDDNLSILSKAELQHFAELWRSKIGLPLFIVGFHPSTVDREKVEILVNAGMNKVRMGIQSGSERILDFYGRKTSRQQILKSAEILSSFYPKISPPNYDIIIDNPMETMQDKEATLSLLRELKRPFMLYVYSLRKLPGTRLWNFALEHPEYDFKSYSQPFQFMDDRWMGIMVYMLGIYNPSESAYRLWNVLAKNELVNRILFPLVRIAYLVKRFYYEIRTSNFEVIANVSPTMAKVLVKMRSKFNR